MKRAGRAQKGRDRQTQNKPKKQEKRDTIAGQHWPKGVRCLAGPGAPPTSIKAKDGICIGIDTGCKGKDFENYACIIIIIIHADAEAVADDGITIITPAGRPAPWGGPDL